MQRLTRGIRVGTMPLLFCETPNKACRRFAPPRCLGMFKSRAANAPKPCGHRKGHREAATCTRPPAPTLSHAAERIKMAHRLFDLVQGYACSFFGVRTKDSSDRLVGYLWKRQVLATKHLADRQCLAGRLVCGRSSGVAASTLTLAATQIWTIHGALGSAWGCA